MRLVNIGFGNLISDIRIVSVILPESAPVKRLIQEARERGALIDATYGRKTSSVIVTDSGHIVLSALGTDVILSRCNAKDDGRDDGIE